MKASKTISKFNILKGMEHKIQIYYQCWMICNLTEPSPVDSKDEWKHNNHYMNWIKERRKEFVRSLPNVPSIEIDREGLRMSPGVLQDFCEWLINYTYMKVKDYFNNFELKDPFNRMDLLIVPLFGEYPYIDAGITSGLLKQSVLFNMQRS